MKIRKILSILILLFCIFGFAKVNATTEITKLEVNVQAPVIGEIPADTTKVTVKANGTEAFEILEVVWFKYNYESGMYEEWTNTSEGFKKGGKYSVLVGYKRPNEYGISQTINVTVNGTAINPNNFNEFNYGGAGDADFEYDYVNYEFGEAQLQKEIGKIEVEVPAPVVGQIPADATKVGVKADDTEAFEILEVVWFKYNDTSKQYEELTNISEGFKKGGKYSVLVGYKRPNKYGISQTINVTVNVTAINPNDFNEFNYGSAGDLDFEYDFVVYDFGEAQSQKETDGNTSVSVVGEITENTIVKEETTKTENVNNPKTGDNVITYAIVILIACSGLVLCTIKNKKDIK